MIWLLLDQLTTLRNGWLSSKFGYYPEGGKSWLVIRENAEERAESIFKHQYKITTEGKRHLATVNGTTNYRQNYMKEK